MNLVRALGRAFIVIFIGPTRARRPAEVSRFLRLFGCAFAIVAIAYTVAIVLR